MKHEINAPPNGPSECFRDISSAAVEVMAEFGDGISDDSNAELMSLADWARDSCPYFRSIIYIESFEGHQFTEKGPGRFAGIFGGWFVDLLPEAFFFNDAGNDELVVVLQRVDSAFIYSRASCGELMRQGDITVLPLGGIYTASIHDDVEIMAEQKSHADYLGSQANMESEWLARYLKVITTENVYLGKQVAFSTNQAWALRRSGGYFDYTCLEGAGVVQKYIYDEDAGYGLCIVIKTELDSRDPDSCEIGELVVESGDNGKLYTMVNVVVGGEYELVLTDHCEIAG